MRAKCFQDREDEERKRRKEEAALWAQRRRDHINSIWAARDDILRVAKEMAMAPLYETIVPSDQGPVVLAPVRWTMRDMLAAYKLMTELGGTATGMDQPKPQVTQILLGMEQLGWFPEGLDPFDLAESSLEDLRSKVQEALLSLSAKAIASQSQSQPETQESQVEST